jgi:TolA-binding protein
MKKHERLVTQNHPKNSAKKSARRLFAAFLIAGLLVSPATAQQPGSKPGPQSPAKQPIGGNNKLSEKERKQERAREIFADAANAQNNGAFPLAIEQWNRLLKEYSSDPLASSARHFLGVCYLQQETPDYTSAITQFRAALEDADLKQREESLVNLGWSLYQQAMSVDGEPRKAMLLESTKVLSNLIEKYPDGSFADKALYYAAEAEARVGNPDRAITLYNQLIQNRAMESSTVRPDALFGLGVTYDEQMQPKLAKENFESFLSKYPSHPLVREVKLRTAEIALKSDQVDQAVSLLAEVTAAKGFENSPNADYALYRYGFALAKAGKFNESSATYKRLGQLFPKSQYSQNSSLAAGQTLMRDKKYDEAYQAFEQLLKDKDDRAAEAAHWMCQISILKGKSAAAVPIARDAMSWGSKSPSAVLLTMDLADGLSATADGKVEARKLYEQLAVENADDAIAPRATYNAAFAALQAGALAEAQRWSEAFAKRFPNDPLASDVAYVRAESALQLGQHESAATAFEQLITSEPTNPLRSSWEMRLAAARYLGGQYDQVIQLTE